MKALRYDVRDVIHAAGLGLRVRKGLVALPGLVVAMVWWGAWGWAALRAAGVPWALVWQAYGPIPWPSLATARGTLPLACWGVGLGGLLLGVVFSSLAVARVAYQQLKGNEFFSVGDAWGFAWRKVRASLVPLGTLLVMIVLGVLGIALLASVASLWAPLWAILFPLGLVAGVAVLYAALVLVLGLCMAPSVVACSSSEGLETTFELFSLQASQGKRAWLYSAVSLVVSLVYGAASAVVVGVGVLFTSWVMDWGHGGAMGQLVRQSAGAAPRVLKALTGWPGVLDSLLAGLGMGHQPRSPGFAPHLDARTLLMALVWFVLFLVVVAQTLITFVNGQTAAYVVLRQLKDDQNLLEEDLEG